MASLPDGSLSILCTDPPELLSLSADHRSYSLTPLSSHFPYYSYSGASVPALIPVPSHSRLVLYLPGLLLVFDSKTKAVSICELPDRREATLAVYGNGNSIRYSRQTDGYSRSPGIFLGSCRAQKPRTTRCLPRTLVSSYRCHVPSRYDVIASLFLFFPLTLSRR
jgi:hypothetical protein